MLSSDLTQYGGLAFWLAPIALYFLYAWLKVIHGAFFGPLSKIPGPRLWAVSRLPRMYMEWQGEEAAGVDALHKKYGPVVRLAPDEVSFAGGAQAWVCEASSENMSVGVDLPIADVLPNRKIFMATERTSARRNIRIVRRLRIGLRLMEPRA
jgi:hypothetical protein